MIGPNVEVLRQDLDEIYFDHAQTWPAARPDFVRRLKEARQEAVAACEATLEQSRSGVVAARVLAAGQDALIQAMYRFICEHLYPSANPSFAERISVVATGGYGRGLLAPGSDIDLLFLYPYRPTPWTESVVETMLYLLWDLGLKVGHAQRSIDECVKLARADLTICTAILESRHIDGDADLSNMLAVRFDQAVVRGTSKKFIAGKLTERDDRHKRQGQTRYLVEPNVKEGKGGLRDLNTLFWIAKYVYRVRTEAELVDFGVFSREEYRLFERCDDFLWSVRCHLHFCARRAEERLTFEFQREIAEKLGYSTRPGLSDVERFMKHYFLIAKDVGDLTRILCSSLEAQHMVQAVGLSRFVRTLTGQRSRALNDDFREENGRILLSRPNAFERDPVNMVRIFQFADQHDIRLHPDTLAVMRRSLRLIDQDVRNDPTANAIFLDLLTDSRDPETLLRLMNETGVLGQFVPEFGKVVAMMQFNMYHHYTVDEHLIRTVGILVEIERGGRETDHPLASQLIKDVRHRRALYVAVFLHDIAKGRPSDHSVEGAKVARELCPRFGLSAAETELVAWLIQEHLTMSITAQSRDLSDPRTIEVFAKVVQSVEWLKLLEILTEADIAAVGPNVWNAWKAQLMNTLYMATETLMDASHRKPRAAIVASKKARFCEAYSGAASSCDTYVDQHSDPYWIRVSTEDALRHAKMMQSLEPGGVKADYVITADGLITQITLVTEDRPALLASVAGVCANVQANVISADLFTTSDGLAVCVVSVPALLDQEEEGQRVSRIASLVERSLSEGALPGAVDRRPRAVKQQAFDHATDILIANDWSNRYTAIEISGLDRPGLLRDLANALAEQRVSVRSAQLATFGERVVDVFYVQREGSQVEDTAEIKRIRQALLTAYDEADGAARSAA